MNMNIAWAHALNACNSLNTVLIIPHFRKTMSYQFLTKDQLTTFLCSLQDLLNSKHEVVKETLPTRIPIIMSDGLVEAVTREKLELSPSFKVEECGLQLKFYQKDREVGIRGYCFKIPLNSKHKNRTIRSSSNGWDLFPTSPFKIYFCSLFWWPDYLQACVKRGQTCEVAVN